MAGLSGSLPYPKITDTFANWNELSERYWRDEQAVFIKELTTK